MSPGTPDTDAPFAEGNPEPASSIITSPLSMPCSPSEPGFSEMSINPAVQNDHDYTVDINEAINSPLGKQLLFSLLHHTDSLSETSSEPSDRSRDSSSRPHRRSSPPPPPLHLSPLHIRSFLSEPEVSVAGKLFLFSPLHHADGVSETSSESGDSDGSRGSSSTRRRRSPPAPPPPRRMAQSGSLRPLSETSSNSGSDAPHRSHSVRRPAPPPPQSPRQSRTPRSPISVSSLSPGPTPTSGYSGGDTTRRSHSVRRPAPPPPQSPRQSRTPRSPPNVSSTSHGPLPLDPAGMARFAQGMKTFAASMTRDLSRQTRGARCSDSVIMSNCVGITNSNVDGITVNNGGTNNSGAGVSFFALFLGSC